MSAYRIVSRLNTFFGSAGQLLAGGGLRFYTEGTTTPKSVYGNEALTVNNGSTVDLDASGRPSVDVWGDGDYFVELYDSDGVKQGDMDNVAIYGGGGLTIPALQSGQFLSNNGTALDWEVVRQVPDPTGQGGKVLGTDGTNLTWQPAPADGAPGANPDITNTASSIRIGDGTTRMRILTGTGSAPASGGRTTSVGVTFPSVFIATPIFVGVTPTISIVTGVGYSAVPSATSIGPSGFTANFDVNASASGANINVPVTFRWVAIGQVA